MDFTDNLYNAIAHAETGHLRDPYIRTQVKGSGSSAYGPVQINKAALTGPGYGDVGFSPEEHEWIQNTYLPQMDLFLKHGGSDMTPGNERYDYGQSGDFNEEDRAMYDNMAKKLMKFEYDRTMKSGGTLDDFIQAWRGESKENDPRYYKKVKDKYLIDNVTSEQGADAF
jgi:hypothetical protein